MTVYLPEEFRMHCRYAFALVGVLVLASAAHAQLPADAVMLDKVKIPEKQKSVDLCPVYLEASDPKLPTWEYKGVKYRGAKADAQQKFLQDPDKYAKGAEKQRFVNNFMQAMSIVWCPVTDEISPGGMTQWKKEGFTWESCCAFCDDSVSDEDFPEAVKKLKARGEKCYELIGAKYTEGAKSPVEGAIKKPTAK
jgi:hypothetical protein